MPVYYTTCSTCPHTTLTVLGSMHVGGHTRATPANRNENDWSLSRGKVLLRQLTQP